MNIGKSSFHSIMLVFEKVQQSVEEFGDCD